MTRRRLALAAVAGILIPPALFSLPGEGGAGGSPLGAPSPSSAPDSASDSALGTPGSSLASGSDFVDRFRRAAAEPGRGSIAWAIFRTARPGHRLLAGYAFDVVIRDGEVVHGRARRGLAERLRRDGVALPAATTAGDRETRPVAIMLTYDGHRLVDVAAADLELAPDVDGRVAWLGTADLDASLDVLLALAGRSTETERRRIAVVGFHDSPRATEALRDLLASPIEGTLRAQAAEGLGGQSAPAALRFLAATARGDADLDVRSEAAEAMGESPDPGATAALISFLAEPGPARVRLEAVEALGERGDPAAVAELRRRIEDDPDEDLQAEALESLVEALGDGAIDDLVTAARRHSSERVRREAVEGLAELAANRVVSVREAMAGS